MTSMVTSAVVLPPVLLAVTVYVAEDVTAVGVPLMAPVEESSERPAGREGDTDQEVMVPPLTVGVTVVMALPLVSVNEFGLYVRDEGATSLTSMATSAVVLPPVLVAGPCRWMNRDGSGSPRKSTGRRVKREASREEGDTE